MSQVVKYEVLHMAEDMVGAEVMVDVVAVDKDF